MYNGLIVGLQYIQEIWVVGWVEHIEGLDFLDDMFHLPSTHETLFVPIMLSVAR